MVKLIFIRGAPAVGKTTITKELLHTIKTKHKLACAYISEDDFRKQMQFKYKSNDLIAHKNSVKLITTIIKKLLKIDNYDFIFIEGQFRYKEIVDEYLKFILKNKFKSLFFQFNLDLTNMKKRDSEFRNTKSKDLIEVKKDIDSFIPDDIIFVNTNKAIKSIIKELIPKIL